MKISKIIKRNDEHSDVIEIDSISELYAKFMKGTLITINKTEKHVIPIIDIIENPCDRKYQIQLQNGRSLSFDLFMEEYNCIYISDSKIRKMYTT